MGWAVEEVHGNGEEQQDWEILKGEDAKEETDKVTEGEIWDVEEMKPFTDPVSGRIRRPRDKQRLSNKPVLKSK